MNIAEQILLGLALGVLVAPVIVIVLAVLGIGIVLLCGIGKR